MIWITPIKKQTIMITNRRNIVTETIGNIFMLARNDIPNPRLITSEPNEYTFGGWRTEKNLHY